MTISHSIPTTTRRPARFYEFNVASSQRGLVPIDRNLALVGVFDSSGSATAATIYSVSEESQADSLFGVGSELALMCRWALKGFRAYGKSANLYAIGIADPAGTAKTETLTVTVTTATAGDVVLEIAGRTIRAGVSAGDANSDIAEAIESAIDEKVAELPVTAGVASNVVTCTAVHTGVVGNDVTYRVVSQPDGVTVTPAVGVAGVGAASIEASLDLLIDRNYHVIAIGNHTTVDTAFLATHLDEMWAAGEKKWRHAVLAETGSLATAQLLADDVNTDYRISVISAEGFKNVDSEIAAYCAAMLAAEVDPAQPFNHQELRDLYMPLESDVPTNAEIETGIAGGLTMLTVNDFKTRAKMVRFVTTKTIHAAVAFWTMQDVTIPRSMAYVAEQVDIALAVFSNVKQSARNISAVRTKVLTTLKAIEDAEIVQNVDDHVDELVAETDDSVATRLNVAIPASVVSPLNQIIGAVNLIVE